MMSLFLVLQNEILFLFSIFFALSIKHGFYLNIESIHAWFQRVNTVDYKDSFV